MQITGRCHCGHVTYEAEIDPENIVICHYTDCQTLSGSPYRVTAVTTAEKIRQTGHEPKCYRKTAESGRIRLQYFCDCCGSPLFVTGEADPKEIWGIRWGSIDQRDTLTPHRQMWCRSAVDWAEDLTDVEPKLDTV